MGREIEDFIKELKAKQSGQPLDFRAIRDRVHELWEKSSENEDDRATLLAIFNATAHLVERAIDNPDALKKFRDVREADYRFLLVKESLVGDNVCAETLEKVTRREVLAGRMRHDHTLRELAVTQVAQEHHSRAELIEIDRARRESAR